MSDILPAASSTETRIGVLFREHLGVELIYAASTPGAFASLELASLDLDSLDMIELVMAIEEEFCIHLTDDEFGPFAVEGSSGQTLADLVALVDTKLAAKVPA